jgi:serine-type D-Ala-D-Ala carboxypeptidase/endopeptidase (penicillin-binding protein 4)
MASTAFASPTWNRLHTQHGLNSADHAFCFRTQSGEVQGANIDRKVRLASVSKLITTLWAIDVKGPSFQYETHFTYLDGKLHITGSKDTVFSRRKLFYLVNHLNQQGISKIDTLTFDANTLVFAGAEDYVGDVLTIAPSRTAQNLKDFLHTPGWQRLLAAYREFYQQTPAAVRERFNLAPVGDLSLSVGDVRLAEAPEFDLESPEALRFTLLSSVIEDYMKFMNIVSNNFIADQTFENLGGEAAFDQYMVELLSELHPDYERQRQGFLDHEPSLKMYTGSGLNTTRNGSRVDNYSTCQVILSLMQILEEKAEDFETHISRLVAVTGSDGGTFRARLQSPILKNTVVAKTGTLFHTSALAGIVYAQQGAVPFGIFHHLTGSKATAQLIQNQMVRTLVDQNGGPAPFDYRAQFFFPVSDERSN